MRVSFSVCDMDAHIRRMDRAMLFVDKKDLLADEGGEHDVDEETDDTDVEDEEHLEYDTPLMHHIAQMLDNTDDELAIRVLVNIIQKQEAELHRLRGESSPPIDTSATLPAPAESGTIAAHYAEEEDENSVHGDMDTVIEEQEAEEDVGCGTTLRSGGGEASVD